MNSSTIMNSATIQQLAAQEKRLDMRGLTQYRDPISVELNISGTAEGSCRVQIGETVVFAGVKLSLEKPYDDTPNEGGIMINVELSAMSNKRHESGPPAIEAIELARVTDRGIRESKAIDFSKLCVTKGEKVWFVIIDVVSVNDAGNLFDACSLAVMSALKSARFPAVKDGKIDYKTKTDEGLPITKIPIGVSVFRVGGKLMADPTQQEIEASDARLSVASCEDGMISAMQKGGVGVLTPKDVEQMVDLTIEKANMLREKLNEVL